MLIEIHGLRDQVEDAIETLNDIRFILGILAAAVIGLGLAVIFK